MDYAAKSKEPVLHQSILDGLDEEAKLLINADSNVVNLKDFCGMTPLHCAARLCTVGLVEVLLEKAADANAITYKTKNPGGYCAPALLGDASHRKLRWEDVRKTTALLVAGMSMETFAAQTVTGRTVWHLISSRGNHQLIGWLLDYFEDQYGRAV